MENREGEYIAILGTSDLNMIDIIEEKVNREY